MKKYLESKDYSDLNSPIQQNIKLYAEDFQESFKQIRYCVYSNLVHLTVEPPFSYYYEGR